MGLGVHAIDLDDGEVVALDPKVLARKGTNVDQPEQIRLAGLHGHGKMLRVIDQSGLGDGLSASWVALVHELLDENGHLIVIPVREGHDNLLVVLSAVGRVWIMNN